VFVEAMMFSLKRMSGWATPSVSLFFLLVVSSNNSGAAGTRTPTRFYGIPIEHEYEYHFIEYECEYEFRLHPKAAVLLMYALSAPSIISPLVKVKRDCFARSN
jgi:hypothetical protein